MEVVGTKRKAEEELDGDLLHGGSSIHHRSIRRNAADFLGLSPETIGCALARSGNAHGYHIIHLGAGSWVVLVRNRFPLVGGEAEFREVWEQHPNEVGHFQMMGKEIPVPRYSATYGMSYNYNGAKKMGMPGDDDEPPPLETIASVGRVVREVGRLLHTDCFAMAVVNWMDGGKGHYIGPHRDREKDIYPNTPIVSVSWGQTRRFRLRAHGSHKRDESVLDKFEVELRDGDVVVMGGRCQTTHTHEILKLGAREPKDRRINVTMRIGSAFGNGTV